MSDPKSEIEKQLRASARKYLGGGAITGVRGPTSPMRVSDDDTQEIPASEMSYTLEMTNMIAMLREQGRYDEAYMVEQQQQAQLFKNEQLKTYPPLRVQERETQERWKQMADMQERRNQFNEFRQQSFGFGSQEQIFRERQRVERERIRMLEQQNIGVVADGGDLSSPARREVPLAESIAGLAIAVERDLLRRLPLGGVWEGIRLARDNDGNPFYREINNDALTFYWAWRIGTREMTSSASLSIAVLNEARTTDAMLRVISGAMWTALDNLVRSVERVLTSVGSTPPFPGKKKPADDPPTTVRAFELEAPKEPQE